MKIRSLLLALVGLTLPVSHHAFQFMKGWTMPVYDPNEEAVREKFGTKKLVVLTGASSGLGRKAALALLRSGEYHVVGAVRDLDKMEAVAELDGFDRQNFTPMYCELNSFDSVRTFCEQLNQFRMGKPIDRLICNAGVYQPTLPYPKWSVDNHEQTMQINFLSHFLMISKLMPALMDAKDPRVIMVGSVTGNDNTVGGGGVYPIADLHDLEGFREGFKNPIAMADGYGFIGAKAYKDSKLCLMMTANLLHTKYHKLTGIAFSSMYPGCIAESPLFREKREWFRQYFPVFMKYITGGFVGEHEAGQRLFQVAHDPRCSKSGVYWSWNGGPREDRGLEALEKGGQISGGGGAGGGWDSIFENDQSAKVLDVDRSVMLFHYATDITGAEWPDTRAVTSPCPTLKVIGAVTKGMVKREELKRMKEMGRPGMGVDAAAVKPPSRRKRIVMAADRAVSGIMKNTLGRAARFASRRILGEVPETAKQGSFHPVAVELEQQKPITVTTPTTTIKVVESSSTSEHHKDLEHDQQLLDQVVSPQLAADNKPAVVDAHDEVLFRRIYDESSSSSSSASSPDVNAAPSNRTAISA